MFQWFSEIKTFCVSRARSVDLKRGILIVSALPLERVTRTLPEFFIFNGLAVLQVDK